MSGIYFGQLLLPQPDNKNGITDKVKTIAKWRILLAVSNFIKTPPCLSSLMSHTTYLLLAISHCKWKKFPLKVICASFFLVHRNFRKTWKT